jgi:acyl-CoA synthetase (AMP-forming)/AMP-acid ligase II
MSVALLLEMAAATNPERVPVVSDGIRLTTSELDALAESGSGVIAASGARHVVYIGAGGVMLPLQIFASARAGVGFTPLNYRLSANVIQSLIDRLPDPMVIVEDRYRDTVVDRPRRVIGVSEFMTAAHDAPPAGAVPDPDEVAVVLFTSGTTSRPKAVELSHSNLTSYVMGTVDFDSATAAEAALICVPPYHIAGISAALSNLYAGRKTVYLTNFDAEAWLRLVGAEQITSATVVPTMLDRIVKALAGNDYELSSLRNLAYGGSKIGLPLVRKALAALPKVGFVNAYGLTETSSTIAVLTPEDHRAAFHAEDPAVARRLASAGRPVPGIEAQVRDSAGAALGPNAVGELFVRGGQVSGRYAEIGSVLDDEGWFATKDIASFDEHGYLYITGRSDDTIIRGGENIAPAEIEDVLIEHPGIDQVVVVGTEDQQWGQAIVAVVVPMPGATPDPVELRDYVRRSLRGSRTPDHIVFRDALPTNSTGKILRRQLVDELRRATAPGITETQRTS